MSKFNLPLVKEKKLTTSQRLKLYTRFIKWVNDCHARYDESDEELLERIKITGEYIIAGDSALLDTFEGTEPSEKEAIAMGAYYDSDIARWLIEGCRYKSAGDLLNGTECEP